MRNRNAADRARKYGALWVSVVNGTLQGADAAIALHHIRTGHPSLYIRTQADAKLMADHPAHWPNSLQ